MQIPPRMIGVLEPLSPALERVKTVLFRPFDAGRWLTIGFGAWLAGLGRSGGGGGGGNFNAGGGRHHGGQGLRSGLQQAWDFVSENLYWIAPAVIGVVVLGLLVWALLTWLSSRGQFMFLHCVATNRAEVREPWGRFAGQAHSLFLFRLVLGLISFVVIVPAVVGGIVMLVVMGMEERLTVPLVLGTLGAFGAAASFGILLAVIQKFTRDFVVPIMMVRTLSCRMAWREFLALASGHKGALLLYLLFQIALAIGVAVAVFGLALVTCCVAGCLLMIPFLGTVLYLPVLVFDRAYSLYYLEQYSEDYRLIPPAV